MRAILRTTAVLATLSSRVLIPTASAQQPVLAISSLPADNHDVYNAYFQYHATWIKWASLHAADTAALNQSATTFAKLIQVDPAEVSVVHSIALSVTQRVAALSAQKAAAVGLSQHDVNQFEIRRQQIILSGVRELQHHLTATSWGGLHQYINYSFRVLGTALPGLPIGTTLP